MRLPSPPQPQVRSATIAKLAGAPARRPPPPRSTPAPTACRRGTARPCVRRWVPAPAAPIRSSLRMHPTACDHSATPARRPQPPAARLPVRACNRGCRSVRRAATAAARTACGTAACGCRRRRDRERRAASMPTPRAGVAVRRNRAPRHAPATGAARRRAPPGGRRRVPRSVSFPAQDACPPRRHDSGDYRVRCPSSTIRASVTASPVAPSPFKAGRVRSARRLPSSTPN